MTRGYPELLRRHPKNPILSAAQWPYPAHTVFNAGLGLPWEVNRREIRRFASVGEWSRRLQSVGFHDTGRRLLQANDPSDNALMAFRKTEMDRI